VGRNVLALKLHAPQLVSDSGTGSFSRTGGRHQAQQSNQESQCCPFPGQQLCKFHDHGLFAHRTRCRCSKSCDERFSSCPKLSCHLAALVSPVTSAFQTQSTAFPRDCTVGTQFNPHHEQSGPTVAQNLKIIESPVAFMPSSSPNEPIIYQFVSPKTQGILRGQAKQVQDLNNKFVNMSNEQT
jgi:hypothetical protein